MAGAYRALVHDTLGAPSAVLRLVAAAQAPRPPAASVRVRVLAAPVHPSDVGSVEGRYPLAGCEESALSLGRVPGAEGVGVIEHIDAGASATSLKAGQRVVFARRGAGTWRTHVWAAPESLFAVPEGVSTLAAATLAVNPPTALLLVRSFVADWRRGETLLQDGANSAVGRLVSALASRMGLRTVNAVRSQEAADSLRAGGTRDAHFFRGVPSPEDLAQAGLPPPRLALSCVAGSAAHACASLLAPGGTLVVYGGMSRRPASVGVSALVFRDVSVRGFWLSRWMAQRGAAAVSELLSEVADLHASGVFSAPPHRLFPLADYAAALAHTGSKAILCMGDASELGE